MEKEFINLIIDLSKKFKTFNGSAIVDYESDIIYLTNIIISSEFDDSYKIMKEIQLFNFSFMDIKSKGNLKSLYNALEDDSKIVLNDALLKLIEYSKQEKQNFKITSKIFEKNIKQKKNLKIIYNMFDIIQQIIEGKFKDNRINEISEFIDKFYFDKEFLEDCVKQYNHIMKLKGGSNIEMEEIKKYLDKNFLTNMREYLTFIGTGIRFYNMKNYKYMNFQYVDKFNKSHTCKLGKITVNGEKIPLPPWVFVQKLFTALEETRLFKLEFSKEINQCKPNVYFIATMLPHHIQNDSLLKAAVSNLVNYVKDLDFYKIILEVKDFSNMKQNAIKTLEAIKKLDESTLNTIKSLIKEILEVLYHNHLHIDQDKKDYIDKYIDDYKADVNVDFMEFFKLLEI